MCCCLLFVVGFPVVEGVCGLVVVCCLLVCFVSCRYLFSAVCYCLLCAACLCVAVCLLFGVSYFLLLLLFVVVVVCCSLCVARCSLFVVCC